MKTFHLQLLFLITPLALLASNSLGKRSNFINEIEPIQAEDCYDCHADGASKGDFTLDVYKNLEPTLRKHITEWLSGKTLNPTSCLLRKRNNLHLRSESDDFEYRVAGCSGKWLYHFEKNTVTKVNK